MGEVNKVVDVKPNTEPKIPVDWEALGATRGYNPRSAEELRLWAIGPPGEGKTTFVSSIPDNIILDFDDGAAGIPGSKSTRILVKDYDCYVAILNKLVADAKAGRMIAKRVTIDTVDEWVSMIMGQLEKEKKVEDITDFGAQGHGWALIKNRCWSGLRTLEEAGYVWSCIGHMTTKTEINPVDRKERTVLRESVFPSFAKKITTKCDFKLTIYCLSEIEEQTKQKKLADGRVISVPDGTRTIDKYYVDSYTTAAKEGKSRAVPTMNRKFEIPFIGGWDEFARRYNEAIAEAKKKYE